MTQRQLVLWCVLGSGTAALFWMCNVLLLTARHTELMCVALLGSAAMGLLARQARRAHFGFANYFGFTVSTLCFLVAVFAALEQVSLQ